MVPEPTKKRSKKTSAPRDHFWARFWLPWALLGAPWCPNARKLVPKGCPKGPGKRTFFHSKTPLGASGAQGSPKGRPRCPKGCQKGAKMEPFGQKCASLLSSLRVPFVNSPPVRAKPLVLPPPKNSAHSHTVCMVAL